MYDLIRQPKKELKILFRNAAGKIGLHEAESIKLLPNKEKINIFTKDMEKSLIKDVVKYAE